jgi:hypothetical protein
MDGATQISASDAESPEPAPTPRPVLQAVLQPPLGRQQQKVVAAARALWPPGGLPPAYIGVPTRNRMVEAWLLSQGLLLRELPGASSYQRAFRALRAAADRT